MPVTRSGRMLPAFEHSASHKLERQAASHQGGLPSTSREKLSGLTPTAATTNASKSHLFIVFLLWALRLPISPDFLT